MRRISLLPAMAVAALLTGCSLLPQGAGTVPDSTGYLGRDMREVEMNLRWQDHRMSELGELLGAPIALMDIPGGGNPPGFVLVFPRNTTTGCLDAFALIYGRDPVIRSYQCR